ncbi:hypothetical protein LCGC14_2930920 [marine sediment metagenome]|uniref:Uncharacterized protein n=1 Tax=marine sediment metagenome TaxID=412755 RepID=A0A0F8Y7W8_9ZZZZ
MGLLFGEQEGTAAEVRSLRLAQESMQPTVQEGAAPIPRTLTDRIMDLERRVDMAEQQTMRVVDAMDKKLELIQGQFEIVTSRLESVGV